MRKTILLTASLVLLTTEVVGQNRSLPYLRDVSVRTAIQLDSRTGIYSYAYTVLNGARSVGKIISLEIDISRDSAGLLLDDRGLQFKNARLKDIHRRSAAKVGDRVVPVSFPLLPVYCDAGLTIRGTVDFFRPLISQGSQVAGYVLSSKGIPGIRHYVAHPRFEVTEHYPGDDAVSNPDSLAARIDADREAVRFHGVTVGPKAPPMNFIPAAWIDTLLSYTHQSVQLGWLGTRRDDDCDDDERADDGIAKNIDKRLEKAKKELSKGDSTKARKELEKLVDKVERTWKRSQDEEKKHKGEQRQRKEEVIMTSEAYALLKYNTEYLIDRLPSEKKKSKK